MYGTGYVFYHKDLNRQTVSPRENQAYNTNGSLNRDFQHESPDEEKEANWRPAPADDIIR